MALAKETQKLVDNKQTNFFKDSPLLIFVDIFLRKKMWEGIFKKISFNTVILLIILFILLAFIVFPKGNKTDENTKLASPPKATPTKLIKPYYLK